MSAAEREPTRRWSARSVLVRPAAVLAAALLFLLTFSSINPTDAVWIPVFGVPAVASVLLAWRPHARPAGVTAVALALFLLVMGGLMAYSGGMLLWVPALPLAVGAFTRRAAWRPRRVFATVGIMVAALAALSGAAVLVTHLQEPDRIVVHLEPHGVPERVADRYLDHPDVASAGWAGYTGPMTFDLRDGMDDAEKEALRREMVADPQIRSARHD